MTGMQNPFTLRCLFFICALNCLVGCDGSQTTSIHNEIDPDHNEIEIDAAFDSGSLQATQYLGNHRFVLQPKPDYGNDSIDGTNQNLASWNGLTWWYHFSISIPEAHLPYPIELEIDASKVWYPGMYAANKVPVISCDGTSWRFVNGWESWNDAEDTIETPVIFETLTCPTTYVAMATPYPWARMETFMESIAANPFILRQDIIGHTLPGGNQDALPLYYLLLSDPGTQSGDKRNIIVISGQHPGETANSWMLTGLIDFLLSDDALAHTLRQTYDFHIYPAVNPEGVKYGHYRRTVDSPLNPSCAWNTDDVIEVKLVRDHMLSQTQGRADFFFDLHGSSAPKHFIYHSIDKPRAREFVDAVAARHPHTVVSQKEVGLMVARKWALLHLHSHDNHSEPPLSFTPEGSYAQGSWDETPDQTTDWKALGAALAQAICDVEGI